MKSNHLNIMQVLVAIVGIVLMCIMPYAGYKLDLILTKITLFSYSGLTMALNVSPVMMIAFVVLALELCFAFSGNKSLTLLIGGVGLISGIVLLALLPVLLKNSNGLWLFDKIKELLELQAKYNFLPESIASAIPAEVTPENVTIVQNYVLDGVKASSGAWVYIFVHIVYMAGAVMSSGGSKRTARTSTPVSY